MIPDFFITDKYENELYSFGLDNFLDSNFLQRLKGISFLSTIDYIYNVKYTFSRYDHSLGVAYLALELCKSLGLSEDQTEILVISNLLHDVGHSPFSHAAETFLLETKKKYHEGLLNTYLRYNTRLFPDAPGLKEILSNLSAKVTTAVSNLLTNQRTGDTLIDELFFCSLNCDKLDGTNRTLFSLGIKCFNPVSFVDAFIKKQESIYVKREYLSQLAEFWQLKANVYKDYIYVPNVLSAEAMLTRSLELSYDNQKDVSKFLSETDEDVLNELLESRLSKQIFNRFLDKLYFNPLSSSNFSLYDEYKERFIKSRFDKVWRKKYENDIAIKLGIDPKYVISHFSFRKDFYYKPHYLNQLSLFEPDFVSLLYLKKACYSVRLSGDVFDIFSK
jgi:HD superfamily phosphohydrolase